MKKLILGPSNVSTSENTTSLALLALRGVVGIAFILHGWGKIQSPFSWMPPESPVPGIFQALAALAEFGGGIALIFGVLTRLASAGLMVTMAVAALFHITKGDPFVQGYELALVYLTISIAFFFTGPGQYSVDEKLLSSA